MPDSDTLVRRALTDAWQHFKSEAEQLSVQLFDESVFRLFFLRAVVRSAPDVLCETEALNRVDAVLCSEQGRVAIEFKFYLYRMHRLPPGQRKRAKGGAGSQNEKEFTECLKKLSNVSASDVIAKYLILVYQHLPGSKSPVLFTRAMSES